MIEIPADLAAELVPFAWLLGTWEGTGVIDYRAEGRHISAEFAHRATFRVGGAAHLEYAAHAWIEGDAATPLVDETGYWRLARPQTDADPGPALLTPARTALPATAEDVERLHADDGFPIQVTLSHSDGTAELYLGRIAGPRIDLVGDAIVRPAGAKPYTAATRMYGLVDGHLLWAWDIAALGSPLGSHASARLAKVA